MMQTLPRLKFHCIFCSTPTNFKDNGKAYCIDCYVKIRDSAHTHKINPTPVDPAPITPMPLINPRWQDTRIIPDFPKPVVIC